MWEFAVVGDGLRLFAVVYPESRRVGRKGAQEGSKKGGDEGLTLWLFAAVVSEFRKGMAERGEKGGKKGRKLAVVCNHLQWLAMVDGRG